MGISEFKDIISSTSSSNNNSGSNNSSAGIDSNILSQDSGDIQPGLQEAPNHHFGPKSSGIGEEADSGYIKVNSQYSDNGISSFMDSLVLKIEADQQGGYNRPHNNNKQGVSYPSHVSNDYIDGTGIIGGPKSTLNMKPGRKHERELNVEIPYLNLRQVITPFEITQLEDVYDLKRNISDKLGLSDFLTYCLFASWESQGKLEHLKESIKVDDLVDLINTESDVSLVLVDSILISVLQYNEKLERLQCTSISVNPLISLSQFKSELDSRYGSTRQNLAFHHQGCKISDFEEKVYKFANLSGVQFMLFPESLYKIHRDTMSGRYYVNSKYTLDFVLSQIRKMNQEFANQRVTSRVASRSSQGEPNDESAGSQVSFGMNSFFKQINSSYLETESEISIYIKIPNNYKVSKLGLIIDPHLSISKLEALVYTRAREELINGFKFDCLVFGDVYLLDRNRRMKNYGITTSSILERAVLIDLPQETQESAKVTKSWSVDWLTKLILIMLAICIVEFVTIYKLKEKQNANYIAGQQPDNYNSAIPYISSKVIHYLIRKLV